MQELCIHEKKCDNLNFIGVYAVFLHILYVLL